MSHWGRRLAATVAGMAMTGAALLGGTAIAQADQSQSTVDQKRSTVQQANGCTGVPDSWVRADFKPACDAHDVCYSAGSPRSRLDCDNALRADLVLACDAAYGGAPQHPSCVAQADRYYQGVRALGGQFYEGAGDPA